MDDKIVFRQINRIEAMELAAAGRPWTAVILCGFYVQVQIVFDSEAAVYEGRPFRRSQWVTPEKAQAEAVKRLKRMNLTPPSPIAVRFLDDLGQRSEVAP